MGADTGNNAGHVEFHGTLPSGTRLRNYELVSVLGHGAFGITYRARDTTLGREVAIKEYLPSSLALREDGTTVVPRSTEFAEDFIWGRERFLEEARTLVTLEGVPAVVRVYDYLEANGTAYMVMALARGETLDQRLKRGGPLPAPVVDRLLYRLLDGLEQVHATGFLHRDIKPANIILDTNNSPTLIDFGASRASMADRSSAMTAVFTPRYAAIEQLMSDEQGPWTDIYGLAVTLYCAIVGKAPPTAMERLRKDTIDYLSRLQPAGFSREVLRGLDAGLAVRAADRPQTVAAWRGLFALAGDETDDATILAQRVRPPQALKPIGDEPTTVQPRVARPPPPSPPPPPQSTPSRSPSPHAPAPQRQAARAKEAPSQSRAAAPRRAGLYAGIALGVVALAAGAYFVLPSPFAPQSEIVAPGQSDEGAKQRAAAAAKQQADEASNKAQAERQKREAEANQKAAADAAAKQQAEEDRAKAEAERQKAAAEATARRQAEAERQKAELDARQKAAAEAAAKRQADDARARAEAERQKADAEAKQKEAAEAAAKRQAEEARAQAAAERQKAEAEAKRKADAEAAAKRQAEEARAKEEADRRKAEAEAEAETRRQAATEATAKRQAEEAQAREAADRQKAENDARQRAEIEARQQAEDARLKAEAERRKAELEAETRKKAEVEAQRNAAEAGEAALKLTAADRQRIQAGLTAVGFDTRGSDGVLGPRSREMIAAWQKARNYPETGYLSAPQQEALLRESAAEIARKLADDQAAAAQRAKATPAPVAEPRPALSRADPRCRNILQTAQLTGALTDEDRIYLRDRCR